MAAVKYAPCDKHAGMTGVLCLRIRHDDGRPATDAEVWAELERLRRDCAEAYQVLGAISTQPCPHTARDVERALDNLCAAAEGKPRPHDDLLPWPKPAQVKRKPRKTALRRLRRMLNELEAKELELRRKLGMQVLPGSCRALHIKDAVALQEVLEYFGEHSGGDA